MELDIDIEQMLEDVRTLSPAMLSTEWDERQQASDRLNTEIEHIAYYLEHGSIIVVDDDMDTQENDRD